MDIAATHAREIADELETFLSILADDVTPDTTDKEACDGEDPNDSPDRSEHQVITSTSPDVALEIVRCDVLLESLKSLRLDHACSQLEAENRGLRDELHVLQDKANALEGTLSRVTLENLELESTNRSQALELVESRRDASRLRRAHAITLANKDSELAAERAELEGAAEIAAKETELKMTHFVRMVNEEKARSDGLVTDLGKAEAMVFKLKEEKDSLERNNIYLSIVTAVLFVYWIYFS